MRLPEVEVAVQVPLTRSTFQCFAKQSLQLIHRQFDLAEDRGGLIFWQLLIDVRGNRTKELVDRADELLTTPTYQLLPSAGQFLSVPEGLRPRGSDVCVEGAQTFPLIDFEVVEPGLTDRRVADDLRLQLPAVDGREAVRDGCPMLAQLRVGHVVLAAGADERAVRQ